MLNLLQLPFMPGTRFGTILTLFSQFQACLHSITTVIFFGLVSELYDQRQKNWRVQGSIGGPGDLASLAIAGTS